MEVSKCFVVFDTVESGISRCRYSRRYRRSLNHKLCRLGIGRCYYFDPFGTLREIKVFGFWGEYGRKAET